MNTTDILNAIDEAIADRCGFCDKALGPAAPSRDFCSEDHQEKYHQGLPAPTTVTARPDPQINAINDILRQQLYATQVDQPLYAVVSEADTREALTLALQATGHQVVADDDQVPDDSLYYAIISHCIFGSDGPPPVCTCGQTSLFVDAGDYGIVLPMRVPPIRLARVIRAINLHPETCFEIFQAHDPDA